jgi:hypothetical protein
MLLQDSLQCIIDIVVLDIICAVNWLTDLFYFFLAICIVWKRGFPMRNIVYVRRR